MMLVIFFSYNFNFPFCLQKNLNYYITSNENYLEHNISKFEVFYIRKHKQCLINENYRIRRL
jgi:hypothetical protein